MITVKKTILIITTVLLFTGCSFSQSQSNIHYTFGVIETSSARKYTVIKYYNDDGEILGSNKIISRNDLSNISLKNRIKMIFKN